MAIVKGLSVIKALLFAITLCLFLTAIVSAYSVGDLNEDWTVNLADLELLMNEWLATPDCFGSPGCADLAGNNRVDLFDITLLAENWLLEATPSLVINEFMASNDTGLEDPQEPGEYPDWIEIYNFGTDNIDMEGMQLNNSDRTYTIPEGVTINPGEYKVFYADRDSGQGSLHTNFKLDASGDEIYLYAKNGLLIDSRSYNQNQLSDHSTGRYPDNTDNWYTMDSPTPLAANTAGMAGKVWFSKLSGTFTTTFLLELSTESPTASIRYTTNGSLPTASSTLYRGAISVSNSAARRIRARAFDSPLAPGPIQSHYYIPLASDIQNFRSNLPVVIIDSFGTNIDNNGSAGCWNFTYPYQMVASVFIDTDKDTGLASTTDVPDFAGRAGSRIRGESSRCWAKRQYAFELWDDNNTDIPESLLGMPSESDWVLNAPYGDKTLIRNVLAYKWANDIMQGFAAPGTKLVEVFYNQNGGNCSYSDYRGVYVLTEKIKVSDNRLDIAGLDGTDTTEPDISGGYILRVDKNNGQATFTTSSNMVGSIQYYDPDEFMLTATQKSWISNWLNEFETDLNDSNFNDPAAGYAQHIDVDSFMQFDVILELFKNIDGFKLSTYFHKERNGKLAFGPLWDFNFTTGNANNPGWGFLPRYSMTTNYTDSENWWNDGFGVYGWHRRLMQDVDYKLCTADKWFEYREDKLSDEQMTADIEYYYALLTTDVALSGIADNAADRNFTQWNILNSWVACNYYYGHNSNASEQGYLSHTYRMEIEWLINWINGQGTPASGESFITDYTDRSGVIDDFWESNRNIAAPPTLLIDSVPMNTGGDVTTGSTLTITAATPGTIYYTTDGTDPRTWTQPAVSDSGSTPFTRTLVPEDAVKAVLVPTGPVSDNWKGGGAFTDTSWDDYNYVTGRNGGVGYEASSGYEGYLTYDLINSMYNVNPTCYIRTSFSVDAADLPHINDMKLKIRFDDAFIAYINGTEVARSSLAPANAVWNSSADTWIPGDTVAFTTINISQHAGLLKPGIGNILAVHGLNASSGSSDLLVSFELTAGSAGTSPTPGGAVADSAVAYSNGITLNATKQIKARIKNGSYWSALNDAVFSDDRVAFSLRITEIMYHPEDPNDEFIEFKNIGPDSIDPALCKITKGVDFTFPHITLAPDAYTVVARNTARFNARYPGYSGTIAGEYTNDKLDNDGEIIRLKDAAGNIIQEFLYDDNWLPITDGKGFSLNIIDPADADLENWNKRLSWQAGNAKHGTPGQDHSPNAVANDAVVINEVLTHTDNTVHGDWIELHNTTGQSINIGNWYLSDDKDNLKKYKIAAGTSIPANGYAVFTSVSNFRNHADPGSNVQFGLSELGEDVYLSSGNGADIAGGYSISENFGAAHNGVSFGRHTKGNPTEDNTDFVQMTTLSRGYANPAAPYVPDLVITEIMYNAQGIQDLLGEYIELHNRSEDTVYLYDVDNPSNTWKFTKGIDFEFPAGASP